MSTPPPLERADTDARWLRLAATLARRPDVPLHGPASTWTARDEYAHLGRWMGIAADRVRAARDGRPRPDLGGDPNLRWQDEDRTLTLDEARERAQRARDDLLGAVDALPAGVAGDGLRALAAGDLVAHLDEHFAFLVDGLLAEETAGWRSLAARLDATPPDTTPSEADGLRWTARDVYAHLGRWFDFAASSLDRVVAGTALPPVPDFDAQNRAWFDTDRALTLDAARRRAADGRLRVLALARTIAPADWTAAALDRLDGNTVAHYREHAGYVRG